MLLIVDDDPRFLLDAENRLDARRGAYFARTAAQAKELLASVGDVFSLVLVDLDLPVQDGFSFIMELRKWRPDLPVIAMSGVYQRPVLESARALGAADVLQKPVGPEWQTTIQTWLARHDNAAS